MKRFKYTYDNGELFAMCSVKILEVLSQAFPEPVRIWHPDVGAFFHEHYGSFEPRLITAQDPEWNHGGFHLGTNYEDIQTAIHFLDMTTDKQTREAVIYAEPAHFWTHEQAEQFESLKQETWQAGRIWRATIAFLVREGYIVEIPDHESGSTKEERKHVLTEKGFAHLNRSFKNGTFAETLAATESTDFATVVKTTSDLIKIGKDAYTGVELAVEWAKMFFSAT